MIRLPVYMHVLAGIATVLVVAALVGGEIAFDQNCPSCAMGPAILYGSMYGLGLVAGAASWVMSLVVIRRERAGQQQWWLAMAYMVVGGIGLAYAGYLMQAS